MTRTSRTILAALAAAGLGAGTAGAQAPAAPEPPAPVSTKYFFQCEDANKVRNNQGAAPWTPQAPATSYTAGGGCGYLDQSLLISTVGPGNDLVDAVFQGTHSGPVDDITVNLHELLLSQSESTLLGGVNFTVALEIDGEVVFDSAEQDPPYEASPTLSSSKLSQEISFSLRNLDLSRNSAKAHDYRLTIGKYYSDTASAWVFGATEIPSGIEFNPAAPSGTEIYVNEPEESEEDPA